MSAGEVCPGLICFRLWRAMSHPKDVNGNSTLGSSVAAAAKDLQSCPTLCNPMDCSPPGSSVHEILLVGCMPSSRGSSQPRERTCISYISCIGRQVLYQQRNLRSSAWDCASLSESTFWTHGKRGPSRCPLVSLALWLVSVHVSYWIAKEIYIF